MEFKVLINDKVKEALVRGDGATKKRLRKAFEYLEAGLWDGGLHVKKLKGAARTVFEGRVGKADRILFTLGREGTSAPGGQGLVYVWALTAHDLISSTAQSILPEAAPFLSFAGYGEETRRDVDLQALGPDGFTQEPLEDLSRHDAGPQRWYVLDEREWNRLLALSRNEHEIFLYLTGEQRRILEASPPLFISGTAGSGKTTLSVYYLLRPPLWGRRKLFLTYNEHLRDFSKRLYDGLSLHLETPDPSPADFLTFRDLCRGIIRDSAKRFPPHREVDLFLFADLVKKAQGGVAKYDAPLVWEEIRSIIKGGKPQINSDEPSVLLGGLAGDDTEQAVLDHVRGFFDGLLDSDFREEADRVFRRATGVALEGWAANEKLRREHGQALQRALRGLQEPMKRHERDFRAPMLTFSEYDRLGRKRAPNFLYDRRAIYGMAEWYQERLGSQGLWDEIDLSRAALRALQDGSSPFTTYEFVCCDEIQDFADLQLSLIFRLPRDPKQLLFAGDPKQIVNPSGFRWEEARALFFRRKLPVPDLHHLTLNFRCVGSIVELGNALLRWKQELLGVHRDEKLDDWKFKGKPPFVIEGIDEQAMARHFHASASGVAVLTRTEKERDEVRAMLQTELVFTIREAKGLEFNTVLLWKFSAAAETRKLWDSIARENAAGLHEALVRHEVNLLYVGLTRARLNLIIYDGVKSSGVWSAPRLCDLVVRTSEVGAIEQAYRTLVSKEDWKKQGDYFLERKYYRQAAECYRNAEEPRLLERASALEAERAGDFMNAARAWLNLKEEERAAEAFENAGVFDEALRIWERRRNKNRALPCRVKVLERSGDHAGLASLWEHQGEVERALPCWLKAGNHLRAAELFEKLRKHAEAAAAFEKAGELNRAVVLYEKVKSWDAAARCREGMGEFLAAARIWKKLKRREDGLRCASKVDDPLARAALHEDFEDWENAFDLYTVHADDDVKKRFETEAADERRTKPARARRAVRLAVLGRDLEAAVEFRKAGLSGLSARCYVRGGALDQAAACYLRDKHYLRAAELFARSPLDESRGHRGLESCLSAPRKWGIGESVDWLALAVRLKREGRMLAASRIFGHLGQFQEAAVCSALHGDYSSAARYWGADTPGDVEAVFGAPGLYRAGLGLAAELLRDHYRAIQLSPLQKAAWRIAVEWGKREPSENVRDELFSYCTTARLFLPSEAWLEILEPFGCYDAVLQVASWMVGGAPSHVSFVKTCREQAPAMEKQGMLAAAGFRYLMTRDQAAAARCWKDVPVTRWNEQCVVNSGLHAQAIAFRESIGDPFGAGVVAVDAGQADRALEFFRKAGRLQIGGRHLEGAKAYLQAYEAFRECGDLKMEARMLEKLKRFDEACRLWEEVGDKKALQACQRRRKRKPTQQNLF